MSKKKTYRIYAKVIGTKYIGEVEAESEEEAIKKAWDHDNAYISLCHQCADQIDDPEVDEITAEEK